MSGVARDPRLRLGGDVPLYLMTCIPFSFVFTVNGWRCSSFVCTIFVRVCMDIVRLLKEQGCRIGVWSGLFWGK